MSNLRVLYFNCTIKITNFNVLLREIWQCFVFITFFINFVSLAQKFAFHFFALIILYNICVLSPIKSKTVTRCSKPNERKLISIIMVRMLTSDTHPHALVDRTSNVRQGNGQQNKEISKKLRVIELAMAMAMKYPFAFS